MDDPVQQGLQERALNLLHGRSAGDDYNYPSYLGYHLRPLWSDENPDEWHEQLKPVFTKLSFGRSRDDRDLILVAQMEQGDRKVDIVTFPFGYVDDLYENFVVTEKDGILQPTTDFKIALTAVTSHYDIYVQDKPMNWTISYPVVDEGEEALDVHSQEQSHLVYLTLISEGLVQRLNDNLNLGL